MKVAVFGGGSSYTPELVKGFLDRAGSFPLTELWLVDISQERLDVVGGFAQRMVAAAGAPFKVVLTTNQRDAIGAPATSPPNCASAGCRRAAKTSTWASGTA